MGGKTPSTAAAKQLATLSELTFNQSKASRKELYGQLTEALKTGGVGARIPIIQRAVEDVKAGTAQALAGQQKQYARAGLSGSPVAIQGLAQTRMAGSQAASRIPTDYAQQLISAAPGLVSSGTGIPGLAAAANLQQQAAIAGAQNTAGLYGAGGSALGQLLGNVRYDSGSGFGFGPK